MPELEQIKTRIRTRRNVYQWASLGAAFVAAVYFSWPETSNHPVTAASPTPEASSSRQPSFSTTVEPTSSPFPSPVVSEGGSVPLEIAQAFRNGSTLRTFLDEHKTGLLDCRNQDGSDLTGQVVSKSGVNLRFYPHRQSSIADTLELGEKVKWPAEVHIDTTRWTILRAAFGIRFAARKQGDEPLIDITGLKKGEEPTCREVKLSK